MSEPNASTAAPLPEAAPETVERFAVLIRDSNGKAELIGQIHKTQADAQKTAEYWQNYFHGGAPVTAETVNFFVPTKGTPANNGKDLLP